MEINKLKLFMDYKSNGHTWITLSNGDYYPDILPFACELYKPVLVLFGELLKSSESSKSLFIAIAEIKEGWMRIQLARVFRKYISPDTPVEMLKKKVLLNKLLKISAIDLGQLTRLKRHLRKDQFQMKRYAQSCGNTKKEAKKDMILPKSFLTYFRLHFLT